MKDSKIREQLRTAIDDANNLSASFCPPPADVDLETKQYKDAYDTYAEKLIDDILTIIRKPQAKSDKKPEAYISDDLRITSVDVLGKTVQVYFKYLDKYFANAIYKVGNKDYGAFNSSGLPGGIHTAIEELITIDYEDQIFEYVQQKVKEDKEEQA